MSFEIGKRVIQWMRKPVGAYMTQRVVVDDLVCEVKVTPIGSWSKMQAEAAASNIKWIMEH
jgi:hypothetical protein